MKSWTFERTVQRTEQVTVELPHRCSQDDAYEAARMSDDWEQVGDTVEVDCTLANVERFTASVQ